MSNIKSLPSVAIAVLLLAAGIAGCTTSNQQSLGVGVKPATEKVAVATTDTSTNTQAALAPAAGAASPAASAAGDVASSTAGTATLTSMTKVGFLPITGAPQRSVSALSKALSNQSRQHAIKVAGSNDRTADYRLKGYMSALNEGTSTTVTFYWDVLDKADNRLYRINGFERESGVSADPWAGVSSKTMHRIAERTMNDLAGWLKSRRG